MSSSSSNKKKIAEFPDVEAKLQKPTKQSAFERQKAEAEAKRQREAAETAAVYEDFVKSFDADGGGDQRNDGFGGGSGGGRGGRTAGGFPSSRGGGATTTTTTATASGFGGGRRHFGGSRGLGGMKSSGPGTLGPATPSYAKKRGFESFAAGGPNSYTNNNSSRRDYPAAGGGGGGGGRPGFYDEQQQQQPDEPRVTKPLASAFDASDDEDVDDEQQGRTGYGIGSGGGGASSRAEEQAVAKPTLRLANLPPATSPAVVKALLAPTNLAVEGVKILAPTTGGQQQQQQSATTERKSIAAIVTLSPETAASDLDAAVSALQNRYLGFGYYLSLHRHLSSAAIAMATEAAIIAGSATGPSSHPFGAKPVANGPRSGNGSIPATGGGRFAPPSSYNSATGAPINSRSLLHVPIRPPGDIKQLRMIHKVVESVLEHGPEFEALLMSRPDVQREERWAWIWDARSQGGVWYRWRLWEILTGGAQQQQQQQRQRHGKSSKGGGKYLPIFEGSHAWRMPDKELTFEYTTGVDEFVSDSEYDSEFDDEDENDGEAKITLDGTGNNNNKQAEEEVFLNPIEKAKLVHLLARLPTTLSKIRKGDIARITAFAITHSNRGADEVVDLVVSNLERPLAFTSANPAYRRENDGGGEGWDEGAEKRLASNNDSKATNTTTATATTTQDTSGAKLVALYVISDILSSSSTSGVRHAWRYRQLLEAALKARRVFEGLGALPERLSWGRLRAEKWKRSIGLVLSLWDGWCVFPNDSQELFVHGFENPPALGGGGGNDAKEDGDNDKSGDKNEDRADRTTRWKTVEAGVSEALPQGMSEADVDEGGGAEEEDGSWDEYTDDEELDNELLAHYHIDGESLLDIDIVGLAIGDAEGDLVMVDGGDGDDGQDGQQRHEQEQQEGQATQPGSTEPEDAEDDARIKAAGGFSIAGPGEAAVAAAAAAGKRKRMTAADMFADSDSGEDK